MKDYKWDAGCENPFFNSLLQLQIAGGRMISQQS